jgi:hypothetical protein
MNGIAGNCGPWLLPRLRTRPDLPAIDVALYVHPSIVFAAAVVNPFGVAHPPWRPSARNCSARKEHPRRRREQIYTFSLIAKMSYVGPCNESEIDRMFIYIKTHLRPRIPPGSLLQCNRRPRATVMGGLRDHQLAALTPVFERISAYGYIPGTYQDKTAAE